MSITLCNNNTLPVRIGLTSAVEAAQAVVTEMDRATAAEGVIAGNLANEVNRATVAESALQTELRAGRVYTMTGGSSPSGLVVPADYSVDLIGMQDVAAGTVSWWRRYVLTPKPTEETDTLKQDAGGVWWQRRDDLAVGLVAAEEARATAAEASLQTEMRNGRVYTMNGNSPSGQTVPVDYSVDLLAMQQRSTNTMTYWRRLNTAPDPAVETETVKLDAGGTWWTLVADPAISAETVRATAAEALKAPLASPALTGTPTVPTAAPGTNTTQAASTAFVAAGLATKADQTALDNVAVDVESLSAAAQVEEAARLALAGETRDPLHKSTLVPAMRPGDAPWLHSKDVSSADPYGVAPFDGYAVSSEGRVVRVSGQAIVAARSIYAMEPSRVYQARIAVSRNVDGPDPEGDAVELRAAWYDRQRTMIGSAELVVIDGLTISAGRQERVTTISRAPGSDLTAPSHARYLKIYAQTHGAGTVTDIEVLELSDLTGAIAWSPDVSVFESRLTGLESIDAGARLSYLESASATPTSLWFASRAAAEAAEISGTVERISYLDPVYGWIWLARDEFGTAMQGADGSKWSPGDMVTPGHFGPNDFAALRDSVQWAVDHSSNSYIYEHVAIGDFELPEELTITLNGAFQADWSSASFTVADGFAPGQKGIRIQRAPGGTNSRIDLTIGDFDASRMPNSGAGEANDAIQIGADQITVRQVGTMRLGDHWVTAGSDTAYFLVGSNIDLEVKEIVGAPDLGVYISAPSDANSPRYSKARVRGTFVNCCNAIKAKRGFQQCDIDIITDGCLTGAGYGAADIDGSLAHGLHGANGVIKVTARRTQWPVATEDCDGAVYIVDAYELGCASPEYTSTQAVAFRGSGCQNAKGFINVHSINPGINVTGNEANFQAVMLIQNPNSGYPSYGNDLDITCSDLGMIAVEGGSAAAAGNNHYSVRYRNMLSASLFNIRPTSSARILNLAGGRVDQMGSATRFFALDNQNEFLQRMMLAGTEIGRLAFNASAKLWEFRTGGGSAAFQIGQNGYVRSARLPQFTDNAAALAAGLTPGQFYLGNDTTVRQVVSE